MKAVMVEAVMKVMEAVIAIAAAATGWISGGRQRLIFLLLTYGSPLLMLCLFCLFYLFRKLRDTLSHAALSKLLQEELSDIEIS